jgi:hypothetical protein
MELDYRDFETYKKKVENAIERMIMQVCERIRADAVLQIRNGKAVATGELMRNINTDIVRQAGMIVGVVGVGGNVKYGIFRHQGTKPHFPPIEAIKKWVIIKGLVRDKGRPVSVRGAKKSVSLDAEAKSIAFLIARKIARKGTQGLPFLRIAFNQNVNWIYERLRNMQL